MWTRSAAMALGAGALLVLVPTPVEARAPWPASLLAGLALAVALFSALAKALPRWPAASPGLRTAALRLLPLAARSTGEEVVWRWLVLGSLAPAIGWLGALVVATVGFALTHATWQGRRGVAVHLVTGGAFGTVFLVTGSLAAAVAAHVGYNVLVALAIEAERPVTATPAPADSLPASLERVSKRFGSTEALTEVDLELHAGETLALLGPNGAGKTTAVGILLGLRRPDAGRARLFGADPRRASARRSIGATAQESGFSPTLTVTEVVDFVRAHYQDPVPTNDLLDRFGLIELRGRQAGGLSSGERRRLAVALAFAGSPRAVFLDEPTTGLDVASKRAVWDAIERFADGGGTVLLTTHNLEEAEALATRVAVLARGRVVADTTVPELKARAGLKRIHLGVQPLPPLTGVARSSREGSRIVLYVHDPAAAVRALVAANADLTGIEVVPVSLEEAFLAVTEAAR